MTNASVSQDAYRDIMSVVCSPVSVVTATSRAEPHGATVSAFMSLSLDPPMVVVSFDRESRQLAVIRDEGRFAVNLLSADQAEVAAVFARRDVDRFAQVAWHNHNGLPRLDEVIGWMECEVHETVTGGDHILVMGRVLAAEHTLDPPLVYAHRTFGTHSGLAATTR